jgi:hypothetical protein
VQALYEACPDWGWGDAKKRAELADPAARYLVVYQQQPQAVPPLPQQQLPAAAEQQQEGQQENSAAAGNGGSGAAGELQGSGAGAAEGAAHCGQPVAFLHYRFEEEAGEAVLYCYEIQVAEAVQVGGCRRFRRLVCGIAAQWLDSRLLLRCCRWQAAEHEEEAASLALLTLTVVHPCLSPRCPTPLLACCRARGWGGF